MKLEPLKKKKQDRQVESWGFSVSGSPDHVLSQMYFWTEAGWNPEKRVHCGHWLLVPPVYTGWSFTRLNTVPRFEAQEPSVSRRELECQLYRYQTSCSSTLYFWNAALPKALGHFNDGPWTCCAAGMCIQIKAIETQVPGPRDSETKTRASEQCPQMLCLAEGGSAQASDQCGNTNHPRNVTPGRRLPAALLS